MFLPSWCKLDALRESVDAFQIANIQSEFESKIQTQIYGFKTAISEEINTQISAQNSELPRWNNLDN